jgi:excisionase family DNA binding protein
MLCFMSVFWKAYSEGVSGNILKAGVPAQNDVDDMTNQANITSGPSILGEALLGAIRQVVREEIKAAMSEPTTKGKPHSRPRARSKPYLNVKQAAEMACLAPSTVRLYIRKGKLKAHNVGRRVVIARGDLDTFLTLNPTGVQH